ncbi:MAG: thioesterase family protein [Actinomycetota bacterium]
MNAAQPELIVSHTSTVTPDQIDDLGHMNVRWYGANAHAGTVAMCECLGLAVPPVSSTYTRHHHEQMEGNELEVRSALLGGGNRLRLYHELRNRADDDLAATFVHELDAPMIEAPTLELPAYGAPRSLSLDNDGFASAPPLDELRAKGLEIRHERSVTEEDTDGADAVPTWLTNNLIWGGERPDEENDWIRTLPSGDRFAYAVMETRRWVRAEPVPLGARIQSFGALIALGDKITHDMTWAYDVETGEPLVVFEGIDVCFNMSQRRAMSIPDDERQRQLDGLHEEYAPS